MCCERHAASDEGTARFPGQRELAELTWNAAARHLYGNRGRATQRK